MKKEHNNDISQQIVNLGFSINETSIYLYVVKHPSTRAGHIIRDLSLHRSVVYTALEALIDRGLLSQSEHRGVYEYRCEDIENLIREQENRLLESRKVVQDLRLITDNSEKDFFIYKGNDYINYICDQHRLLNNTDEVLFLGPAKSGNQSTLGRYWSTYHKNRIEKGFKCRILYDRETPPTVIQNRNSLAGCEARFMPFGAELPVWFIVWRDTVAQMTPGESVTFITRSKSAADGFRSYFEFMWKQSKKYLY